MNEKYNPSNCGYAMDVGGVTICRLECRPCHNPCALEHSDKAMSALQSLIKSYTKNKRKDGEKDV